MWPITCPCPSPGNSATAKTPCPCPLINHHIGWHFIYTEDTIIRRTCGHACVAQVMRMARGKRSISNLTASRQGNGTTFIATFYLPQYSLLSPSSPTDHSRTMRVCEMRCERGGGQRLLEAEQAGKGVVVHAASDWLVDSQMSTYPIHK